MKITAIVLTLNEAKHLARCILSLKGVVADVVVVDCYSTDATLSIARYHGAKILQHEWVNHATQFNWALTQIDKDTEWVIRIDADEVLTPFLANEIKQRLPEIPSEVEGVYCGRRMTFLGQPIRHGGLFPIRILRLFRYGCGECENRWMDEHIKVAGHTENLQGEILDDNLNSLTWWINKHNKYASLEAVEMLNLEYAFMVSDKESGLRVGGKAGIKRWLKHRVYARLPGGFRALAYFLYRYIFRFGFLDGQAGAAFHILQGFWYRYLVDAKIDEVKRYMKAHDVVVTVAIDEVLNLQVGGMDPPKVSDKA